MPTGRENGKSQLVSLRLQKELLSRLKGRGDAMGLPYQTVLQRLLLVGLQKWESGEVTNLDIYEAGKLGASPVSPEAPRVSPVAPVVEKEAEPSVPVVRQPAAPAAPVAASVVPEVSEGAGGVSDEELEALMALTEVDKPKVVAPKKGSARVASTPSVPSVSVPPLVKTAPVEDDGEIERVPLKPKRGPGDVPPVSGGFESLLGRMKGAE